MSRWPIPRELNGGLTLRLAGSQQDIERIAALHALVFEPPAAAATLGLVARYPGLQRQDFCLVEDRASGQVVSSICLVPTTWLYEGLPLKVGELGIVATHPDYRRRGLIREQMGWFEAQLHEREYDLASISGIPFFYRQFGYEYILPMGPTYQLWPDQVPNPAAGEEKALVRPAGAEDMPLLLEFLAAASQGLALAVVRDPAVWLNQDDPAREDEEALDTYLVREAGRPSGYFRLRRRETRDCEGVFLVEAWLPSERACLAALRLASELAPTRRFTKAIYLAAPPSSLLARLAQYLGARPLETYAWQIRIPDAARFLRHIAPALEKRLAASFLAGYNGDLRFDLYTETIELRFEQGHLAGVCSPGPQEDRRLHMPWWVAWQLWLGYRSRQELTAWYPDAHVEVPIQPLIDVLFPKRESWIYPTF